MEMYGSYLRHNTMLHEQFYATRLNCTDNRSTNLSYLFVDEKVEDWWYSMLHTNVVIRVLGRQHQINLRYKWICKRLNNYNVPGIIITARSALIMYAHRSVCARARDTARRIAIINLFVIDIVLLIGFWIWNNGINKHTRACALLTVKSKSNSTAPSTFSDLTWPSECTEYYKQRERGRPGPKNTFSY